MDNAARLRVLGRHVQELLDCRGGSKELGQEIGFSRRTMHVDQLASVFTGASVSEFHFALDMKEGRKILLITGNVPMMARFVVAYLIRRDEHDPELAAHL